MTANYYRALITYATTDYRGEKKNLNSNGAQHPRNLDPPFTACYLPAEAFSFPVFN
jgi:hypothetical protein